MPQITRNPETHFFTSFKTNFGWVRPISDSQNLIRLDWNQTGWDDSDHPDNVSHETKQALPKDNYVDENSHTDTLEKEGFETAINSITSIKELTDWGIDNGKKIKESNHTDYVRGIFASRKTALEDRV